MPPERQAGFFEKPRMNPTLIPYPMPQTAEVLEKGLSEKTSGTIKTLCAVAKGVLNPMPQLEPRHEPRNSLRQRHPRREPGQRTDGLD